MDAYDDTHPADRYEDWQRETIRRYGWALQAVLGDEESPPYVYSIGLTGWGHPELVIFGTEPTTAAGVLNDLGEAVRVGYRLAAGERYHLAQGVVSLLDFPDSARLLPGANTYYRGPGMPPVPALIVLADGELEQVDGPDPHGGYC